MPINPFTASSGLPPQPKPLFMQKVPKSDSLANALMQSAYAEAPKSPFDALGKLAMLYSGKRQQDRYIRGLEEKSAAERQAELEQYKTFAGAFGDDPMFQKAVESGNLDIVKALTADRMKSRDEEAKIVPKGATVYKNGNWITPPAGVAPPADFADVSSVRKEIQDLPSYKSFKQAEPIFATMVDAATRDSKAADLNLVYGLGKIFDPNSVVREGEIILVKDTSALPDWLIGEINSLNGGARLQSGTRQAILAEAQSRMDAYRTSFQTDLDQFKGITDYYGIPQEHAIPPLGETPTLPDASQFNQPVPGAGSSGIPLDAAEQELIRRGYIKTPDGQWVKR